jgi:hypothetical protein
MDDPQRRPAPSHDFVVIGSTPELIIIGPSVQNVSSAGD